MHTPLTLQQLADCLDNNSHICLVHPFPYPRVCKKRFDAEDSEARKRAISRTRSALENLPTGASVSKATYRILLESIAKDCCCPDHRKDDVFEQFAYHWMASGILDGFLKRQGWRWETEKWLCLRSDKQESCPPLRKTWAPLHRNAVYCSLNRLAIFAEYPRYFNVSLVQSAIEEFIKYWTCASHKIDAEQIRHELKIKFRIHTDNNSSPESIAMSDRTQERCHVDASSGVARTCENEEHELYLQDPPSSSISGARAMETPGPRVRMSVVSAATAPPSTSSTMTPLSETQDQRVFSATALTALIDDEHQSSPDSSPSASRDRKLVTPISALHGRSESGSVHPFSLTDQAQYTGIRNHKTFPPPVIVDLTEEDDSSVPTVPTTTANDNLKIALLASSGRSVSAGPSSPPHASHDPVTPERPGPPKSSASAPAVRSRLSDSTIICRNQDFHRSCSRIYTKPRWDSYDEYLEGTPSPRSIAVTHTTASSPDCKSMEIEFHEVLANDKKETLESVAHSVFRLAQQPARTKPKKGEPYTNGWIYILRIMDIPGYLKIGRTTQLIPIRKNQIANCNKKLVLEVVDDKLCYQKISNHERVEKLIHEDLKNERCYFRCPMCEDSNGQR